MIERSHLEILRAVNQQGSLTAAAECLHLTQSALSHSIRKLEHQLGTDVWVREGRQLRLTQSGEYLLSLANRLLPQLEHAEMLIGQFARGQRGTLRIGIASAFFNPTSSFDEFETTVNAWADALLVLIESSLTPVEHAARP